MSAAKANCAICGKPLVYFEEAREVTCAVCGKKETGHNVCEDGHYVCDACHRASGVEHALEVCRASTSKDPVAIMMEAMDDKSVYQNGPEHHTLIGAALLAAYANAGGELDLDAALEELKNRSMCVPGGACGYWGVCGSATSAGQALSIITGSTPMARGAWAQCMRATSEVLARLADIGGPRCCKRGAFTAATVAVPAIAEATGVQMELPERIVCRYFRGNVECLQEECPYFPS